MTAPAIDLGDGHSICFTAWSPDRALNPQYADLPDIPRCGAIERHPIKGGEGFHECSLMFELPGVAEHWPNHPRWTVVSWEPLTLTPSILCKTCGSHGFITHGKWVEA